jgi:hypothetical protein
VVFGSGYAAPTPTNPSHFPPVNDIAPLNGIHPLIALQMELILRWKPAWKASSA